MILDDNLLDSISQKAKDSPRLRMNYNLHDNLEAKAQRLFNALEPGTIIPIHRHKESHETYILVRGRIRVTFYDDLAVEEQQFILDNSIGNFGIHIPAGQWHDLEVLESGSVIFEVKDGPYTPLDSSDIINYV